MEALPHVATFGMSRRKMEMFGGHCCYPHDGRSCAGTEVAKEAADIVIMDDNFNSIVKSVLWGRSVFANLRKFLQFQLTINGVALVIAFVAAVTNGQTPLNVLQLLWVNLIMDSLAALGKRPAEFPDQRGITRPCMIKQLPFGFPGYGVGGRVGLVSRFESVESAQWRVE